MIMRYSSLNVPDLVECDNGKFVKHKAWQSMKKKCEAAEARAAELEQALEIQALIFEQERETWKPKK